MHVKLTDSCSFNGESAALTLAKLGPSWALLGYKASFGRFASAPVKHLHLLTPKAALPAPEKRGGHKGVVFRGWFLDSQLTRPYHAGKSPSQGKPAAITTPTVLYPKWEQKKERCVFSTSFLIVLFILLCVVLYCHIRNQKKNQ